MPTKNHITHLAIAIFSIALLESTSYADSDDIDIDAIMKEAQLEYEKKNEQIQKEYKSTIDPILKRACYDCHSNKTIFPWYYKIPPAKWLMDKDIKEASSHLKFNGKFPFSGHGTVLEDLNSIENVMIKESMPPKLYLLMHPSSKITQDEKNKIINWLQKAKSNLSK